ncbi:MAG: hypothetical protein GC196_08130 [Hyphomonas sp.]|jgi:hypothetical protein|nr:hypothetical protein [Hyphomonas sp.]
MFTKKRLLAASAALLGAATLGAGFGFAQSGSAKAEPFRFEVGDDPSLSQVRARLGEQGFDVREVEYDDRKIEVKGTDASGKWMEIYFHPASGEELRRERGDDCDSRDDDNDDRWDD